MRAAPPLAVALAAPRQPRGIGARRSGRAGGEQREKRAALHLGQRDVSSKSDLKSQPDIEDKFGRFHTLCKLELKYTRKGKSYRSAQLCHWCARNNTIAYCRECNKCFCYPFRFDFAGHDTDHGMKVKKEVQEESCFIKHVQAVRRESGRKRKMAEVITIAQV